MSRSKIAWAAAILFASVMTVAEALAVQAIARDAQRWLSSDTAHQIRTAGRALAGAVTGTQVVVRAPVVAEVAAAVGVLDANIKRLPCSSAACVRLPRVVREVKWTRSRDEI